MTTRGGTAALPPRWVEPIRRGPRIEIHARFDSFVRALLGVWVAVWAAGGIVIALGWLGVIMAPVPPVPLWIAFVLAYTAGGAFVAWRLAWVLQGREIIELKDGVLSISRGIGRWTGRPKRYPWESVGDLRAGSFRRRLFYPSWGRRFVGKGDGFVAFDLAGDTVAFGRGLTRQEARDLVELLGALASDGRA